MQALTFFFAFVAVLALIGLAAWLVRRFASNRLGANTNRSRMPRLAVIDAAAVDGRRRLVLVRRDNIEHLLMIGGPTDIVVEPNIVRAMPGRDQLPPRPAVGGPEPQPRIAPLPDTGNWSDADSQRAEALDHAEPQMPEPPPRPTPTVLCRRSAPTGPGTAHRTQRSLDRICARAIGRPSGASPGIARRADAVAGNIAQRAGDTPPPTPERSAQAAAGSRTGAPGLRRHRPRPCLQRIKISPRWRNGLRQRCAGQAAIQLRRRLPLNRPRAALLPAASPPQPRRSQRHRRAGLRILKTRWRHCWAVRRTLREAGGFPA